MQAQIDKSNAEFWDEICGTGLAQQLGITDHSPESLKRFDDAYYEIYPYLLPIIRPERMAGKKVLEVGLGFGTVGQTLAENAEEYHGLDIAAKPVELMNQRMRMANLNGMAVQGSCHSIPLPDESVDFVVSIGCYHHTGDVQKCIDETWRVLKPRGHAILMVYNKFSLRQWKRWPFATFRELARHLIPFRQPRQVTEDQRAAYDASLEDGKGAPETVFLSKGDLRKMLKQFSKVKFWKQNCDPWIVKQKVWWTREKMLGTMGRLGGLDIYLDARK